MNVKDFYYDLPEELIAQTPLKDRTASRLLHINGNTGALEHLYFYDVKKLLRPGDCLVLNDTRVIPARLYGVKKGTGAAIEFVLLNRLSLAELPESVNPADYPEQTVYYEVILRPGRRAHTGSTFVFGDGILEADIVAVLDNGNRIAAFRSDAPFEETLDKVGLVPLPPYIKEKLDDPNRYQTVYARENGSAAAPTAGLHFTNELLDEIRAMGVETAFVTLHVGLGTFRPVKVEKVEDHYMHEEKFEITKECCDKINNARANGGRIISVGTTSTRVLESVSDENGFLKPTKSSTRIFIYPGYKYKAIDCLITNFHLPESTLIMLVSALAGYDNIMNAYKVAVKEKYRFFSFGDACFIEKKDN